MGEDSRRGCTKRERNLPFFLNRGTLIPKIADFT
jgi:hypothetical protein